MTFDWRTHYYADLIVIVPTDDPAHVEDAVSCWCDPLLDESEETPILIHNRPQ